MEILPDDMIGEIVSRTGFTFGWMLSAKRYHRITYQILQWDVHDNLPLFHAALFGLVDYFRFLVEEGGSRKGVDLCARNGILPEVAVMGGAMTILKIVAKRMQPNMRLDKRDQGAVRLAIEIKRPPAFLDVFAEDVSFDPYARTPPEVALSELIPEYDKHIERAWIYKCIRTIQPQTNQSIFESILYHYPLSYARNFILRYYRDDGEPLLASKLFGAAILSMDIEKVRFCFSRFRMRLESEIPIVQQALEHLLSSQGGLIASETTERDIMKLKEIFTFFLHPNPNKGPASYTFRNYRDAAQDDRGMEQFFPTSLPFNSFMDRLSLVLMYVPPERQRSLYWLKKLQEKALCGAKPTSFRTSTQEGATTDYVEGPIIQQQQEPRDIMEWERFVLY